MWAVALGLVVILCVVVLASLLLTRFIIAGFFKWMEKTTR